MRPRLSIVLPAYREAESLREALRTIQAAAEPVGPVEYIVVDDGSPDDTWSILTELAQHDSRLRALRLSRNFGKEAAVAAGLVQSRGDAVIVMDVDLQHPPELIPEMVRLWEQGQVDVVNTVKRRREGEGPLKKWLTCRYFGLFTRLVGMDVANASDFKLLDRRVVERLNSLPERARFFRGLVAWIGYRQATLPFDVTPRRGGQSSWSLFRLMTLAVNSIVAFSTLPMHLMTLLGAIFGYVSIVLAARTMWLWIGGSAVPGFTTVILMLILIGSILMIGLGIIGAYIAKIYEEVKSRPNFIIQENLASALPSSLDIDTDRTVRKRAAGSTCGEQLPAEHC